MVKKLKTDEVGLDDDLDIPDFNFDAGEIKDDRKPVTKLKDAVIESAKNTLTSPSTYQRVLRNSLPAEYGEAYDKADKVADTLGRTVKDAVKEVKPAINDITTAIDKMVPEDQKKIKNLLKNLKEWSQSDYRRSGIDLKKQREDNIQLELAAMFKEQVDTAKEDRAEGRLQSGINLVHHKDQMTALNSIASDTSRLQQYQNKVTQAWQRKTLEIQLRSYGVQVDILEEIKRTNEQKRINLEAIRKNTGLPDFAKLRTTEAFHESLRNKFITKGQNYFGGMFNKGDYVTKILKNIDDQVKQTVGGITNALSMAAMGVDMAASTDDMSFDDKPKKGLVEKGLGWVTQEFIGEKLKDQSEKVKKGLESSKRFSGIRKGQYHLKKALNPEYAKQRILEATNSDYEDPLLVEEGGIRGIMKRAAIHARNAAREIGKDILPSAEANTSVETDKITSARSPAVYSNHAQKALTEIIPGYLARILREVTGLVPGNKTDILEYDLTKNKFRDAKVKAQDIKKLIVRESDKEMIASRAERGINRLDTDKELSDDQKERLAEFMVRRNMTGKGTVDLKHLTNANIYKGTSAEAYADTFTEFFKKKFDADKDNKITTDEGRKKHGEFTEWFHSLSNYVSDPRAFVQTLINSGDYEALRATGLLKDDDSGIDINKVIDELTSGIRKKSDAEKVDNPDGTQTYRRRRVGRSDVNLKEDITPVNPKD